MYYHLATVQVIASSLRVIVLVEEVYEHTLVNGPLGRKAVKIKKNGSLKRTG